MEQTEDALSCDSSRSITTSGHGVLAGSVSKIMLEGSYGFAAGYEARASPRRRPGLRFWALPLVRPRPISLRGRAPPRGAAQEKSGVVGGAEPAPHIRGQRRT